MKNLLVFFLILVLSTTLTSTGCVADELPVPAGVVGIESGGENAWLAMLIEVPNGMALNSLMWYNNDGQIVFPKLMVGTGHQRGPGSIMEMVTVKEHFSGPSEDWGQVYFTQPIAASKDALYVVFEFPEGIEHTANGAGGGPAFGYISGTTGTPGWLSGDGEVWIGLYGDYSYAVIPSFTTATNSTTLKNLIGDEDIEVDEDLVLENYLESGPNPFNPVTEIKLGLVKDDDIKVDVFDIRGHRVCKVLDEHLTAGRHTVFWKGQDDRGRDMASGVYFVRLKGNTVDLKKKLVLVR